MRSVDVEDIPADPRVRAAVARFLREARAAAGGRIKRVILYGSTARGEAGPESDVDLLVEWDGRTYEGLDVLIPITTTILIENGVDISAHPYTPAALRELEEMRSPFLLNVRREGLVVA